MNLLLDIVIYFLLGLFLSWIFYYIKRKDLLGGFAGGLVIGMIGSVLGVLVLSDIVKKIIDIMQSMIGNVDVLTGLLTGYLALFIYNKINHDRTRPE